MALLFGADNDRVEYTANAALDLGATGTIAMWLYPTDDTARQGLFVRSLAANAYYEMAWRADQAGDYFLADRQRATADALCQANAANFAAYGLNKWLFVVFVFDTGGANGDQKILIGDLTRPAAEPSSYTTQTAGSGSISTNYGSSNFFVGNQAGALTREFKGRIAWVGVWNTALTTQQIISEQFRPRVLPGNTVLFSHLGYPGTTCPDWSGNAIGATVTGATNTSHVPMAPLFGGTRTPSYIAAAAPPPAKMDGMFFGAV